MSSIIWNGNETGVQRVGTSVRRITSTNIGQGHQREQAVHRFGVTLTIQRQDGCCSENGVYIHSEMLRQSYKVKFPKMCTYTHDSWEADKHQGQIRGRDGDGRKGGEERGEGS